MSDQNQHFHYRKIRQMGEEALGDWLYPNALYGGGCCAGDRACIQIEGKTEDSLELVSTFYWRKCGFDGEPKEATSTCALEGNRPWFMFRAPYETAGGAQVRVITHITSERSITVVAMPSAEEGWVHLDITRVPHQSTWWNDPDPES